jgi:hypothetical protein
MLLTFSAMEFSFSLKSYETAMGTRVPAKPHEWTRDTRIVFGILWPLDRVGRGRTSPSPGEQHFTPPRTVKLLTGENYARE